MKNIFKVFTITAGIVLLFNVNSFALVDVAAWGGGAFKGKVENSSADYNGWQYGLKAHYNTSLIPLLELGIGGYYEKAKYEDTSDKLKLATGKTQKLDSSSYGFDGNLILTIPILHPYLRGTYAIKDKIEDDSESFKAYGLGGGIELSFVPFFRLFGEYMYKTSDHGSKFTVNEVNFGLKFDL